MKGKMMRVLITGNMGYVGPRTVRYLKRQDGDIEIIGLDMGFFSSCLTGGQVIPETMVDLQYFGDVRSIDPALLEGVDAVVHLAAVSNDPMGNRFEKVTDAINHLSSVRIAGLAREKGVKNYVFASSCSMYGAADDKPRDENSPLNPLTAYARSKVATEEGIKDLADDDFTVTSLRFATACGMSERLRLDLVLNDFVASAMASGKIEVLSDGTPWRPLINVNDMARAIHWAINRTNDNGGAFVAVNVGSDQWNYQVKDLAEAVAEVISGTEVTINENAQPDKRSYQVSFSKFRSLAPDHQPRYDLETTIRQLWNGLEAIGFNDPDFRNSDLIRLKKLTRLIESKAISEDLAWNLPF